MGLSIVKIKDKYLEFSSMVDAPVTDLMTLDEFKEYYKDEYGESGMRNLDQRLKRVEEKGTSSYIHESAEDELSYNRAGKNESILTIDQIYEFYQNDETYENRPQGTYPEGMHPDGDNDE
jgi:hypothetical protein